MKKNNQTNELEISDKALLKEKVAYTIAAGLFTVGAIAFGSSIGFGIAGVLKPLQAFLAMLVSTIPTAVAFGVGVAGTPVERGVEEMPKISKEEFKQFSQESDDCSEFDA